jgi:hypothetical protein
MRRGGWIVLIFLAANAFAQEPTQMEAATHPGTGQFYGRILFSAAEYDQSSVATEEQDLLLRLAYGIRPTLALLVDADFRRVDALGVADSGISTVMVRLKYQVFKRDLGPLNTWRASITGGVGVPGDDPPLAPEDPFPQLGVVSTAILGRHGLNGQIDWKGYGGEPDIFELNASHLYRLSPAEYAADTQGAWYTMLESLNQVADNGRSRSDVAAGLLYEARRWAAELSLRLPVHEDDLREYDHQITFGWRLLL